MPMCVPARPGSGLQRRVADHVAALCAQPDRNVGGPGNLAAAGEPFEVLPGPYSNPAEVARFFADVVRATR